MLRPLLLLAWAAAALCGCPLGHTGTPPEGHPDAAAEPDPRAYYEALAKLDFEAVEAEIAALLTQSQDAWPADFGGHYGGLMIRLAWHCAGSYRLSDGRGGCDGARQRFEPERSWEDNTNLDKARRLLYPIKRKYGLGLSWGDLFTLAGTVAIESMGGPVAGFCAGRVDEASGFWSEALGPSAFQEELFPCPEPGRCRGSSGLGATTVGLIYVNPGGPMENHNPADSALEIREVFGRMGMNDSETVALIGGGHAFGKAHGACPNGAGPSPREQPSNPWPGLCGTGKCQDTYTSGYEGAWVDTPTKWSNGYFKALLENEWELHKGPGGKFQWRVRDAPLDRRMMLTSDIALLHDPSYLQLAREYLANPAALDHAFSEAWYKLMSRDMGPRARCRGPDVPPPQWWQYPLPPTPAQLPDFRQVGAQIDSLMKESQGSQGHFIRLAFSCAWTFRRTDYAGGCNGARIRLPPANEWPSNVGLEEALELLEGVKSRSGPNLSWADLIVLAGTHAAVGAGARPIEFCSGRTDAQDGEAWKHLEPRVDSNTTSFALFKDFWLVMGLTLRETVALSPASPLRLQELSELTADYFKALVFEQWQETLPGRYVAGDPKRQAAAAELLLAWDPEYLAVVLEYTERPELLRKDFSAAWEKLMASDLFDFGQKHCITVGAPPAAPPAGVATFQRKTAIRRLRVEDSDASAMLQEAVITATHASAGRVRGFEGEEL